MSLSIHPGVERGLVLLSFSCFPTCALTFIIFRNGDKKKIKELNVLGDTVGSEDAKRKVYETSSKI